jgi:hypothetical protein
MSHCRSSGDSAASVNDMLDVDDLGDVVGKEHKTRKRFAAARAR